MIKTIFFDMDGVLFDTEIFYAQKRYDFFSKYQIEYTWDACCALAGANSHDYIPDILKEEGYNDLEIKRLTEEYHTTFRPKGADFYKKLAFDGLEETLKYLSEKGYQLALVSNSSKNSIDLALESCSIQNYFSYIVPGDDVKKKKPDPEIYLKAIQESQCSCKDIVVIEDSTKGIQAAKAAGLRVICKKDLRFHYDQSACWKTIDDLKNLLEIL